MDNLEGISAIVTGGASGLGAATANMLKEAGANVTTLDLKGGDIDCDVTSEESVASALEQIEAPRICINCAGILVGEKLIGSSLENFQKAINVNLVGTFNIMRLVSDKMKDLDTVTESGERGVIINTASIAAFEGQIGQVAYSASKGGVVAMTLPAARELARYGIRVMAIAPGVVETPMVDAIPQEIQDSIASSIPFPSRFAKPEEFAKLALHIIDNEMLNGEVIRLDGATRLAPR